MQMVKKVPVDGDNIKFNRKNKHNLSIPSGQKACIFMILLHYLIHHLRVLVQQLNKRTNDIYYGVQMSPLM